MTNWFVVAVAGRQSWVDDKLFVREHCRILRPEGTARPSDRAWTVLVRVSTPLW